LLDVVYFPSIRLLKILILKPSSLGDVVQALPVLRLLKRHIPSAEIHWWIDTRLSALLEGDRDLAGVVAFDRKGWARPGYWPELLHNVLRLRAQKFDWVIDLQCLARSGAIAYLANGKMMIGLDEAREGARGFYDIAVPRGSYHTHAVDWYLSVLPKLGVPVHWDFEWLPERPAVTAAIQKKWNGAGKRWIALQPGARWTNKRWPVSHFATLLQQLAVQHGDAHFAILGGKEDKPLADSLAAAAPDRCVNLAGETTLPEMVEWLRRSELLITNDTGPMHVAAALKKPVVALFGPTEPRRTGPYGQLDHVIQHSLPCIPCMKSRCHWHNPMECLTAIHPEQVMEKIRTLRSGM
jgi:heptosyltransferase-1